MTWAVFVPTEEGDVTITGEAADTATAEVINDRSKEVLMVKRFYLRPSP